jgi:hypothetical protein
MSIQGYLVKVNNVPIVVKPYTSIVHKNGQDQFWFYHNHMPVLAVKGKGQLAYKAKVN